MILSRIGSKMEKPSIMSKKTKTPMGEKKKKDEKIAWRFMNFYDTKRTSFYVSVKLPLPLSETSGHYVWKSTANESTNIKKFGGF